MEFEKEILCKLLETEPMETRFPQLQNYQQTIETKCYQALLQIKYILEDDNLDDPDYFMRIEEIVRVFEKLGSDCGSRHDFS